jgi:hypothetical protein
MERLLSTHDSASHSITFCITPLPFQINLPVLPLSDIEDSLGESQEGPGSLEERDREVNMLQLGAKSSVREARVNARTPKHQFVNPPTKCHHDVAHSKK